MNPTERLKVIRRAHECLDEVYRLLLQVMNEGEENRLSRKIALIEDIIEEKTSAAVRDRDTK